MNNCNSLLRESQSEYSGNGTTHTQLVSCHWMQLPLVHPSLKTLRSASQDVNSLKTYFCICKACTPDETVNGGHSRATPESISPTPILSHSQCSLTEGLSYYTFFLKPHLFNKKTMFTFEISFLGLNKLPSVSGMLADIRKKRTKLEKQ